MAIFYYSLTGNTKAFAERFAEDGFNSAPIDSVIVPEPFVLLTPTYNFGKVPEEVSDFLTDFSEELQGVIAFGNRNWGEKFANAGDIIAKEYNVPLLRKIELRGTEKDYEVIKEELISWQPRNTSR
ncbi:class Ib ribonucleoside-diphosphate reductase assembly flavoprotein NrdI [Oceanobacillus sojae]|uniref:class Ib ribonucleoside-diphosphate reductase assembly flavoprotein NrdI n=1 Tax=Oceanobacillus sojae TaxID=582851 RepID=UPI0011156D0B|nr:class Ib ribonucleoside-diphosphate reductase assembly flavoprotein NrdI [Oceanobacillus sojae]